jgi:cyclophilin family peptidyl-prolyl cis-trans isomerase
MQTRRHSHKTLLRAAAALAAALLMLSQAPNARAQKPSATAARASARDLHAGVSTETLLRIVRAEDERRWEEADLGALLAHKSAAVRGRAALAAGRIGDEAAVPALASLMRNDVDASVRATAAFALGEVESPAAADMLLTTLRAGKTTAERARALEALGKIAAALPATDEARRKSLGAAIVSAVESEQKSPRPDTTSVLLGLTALLRARPDGAGRVAAFFLASSDARVRADAANTLARLRAKDPSDKLRALLTGDLDPVVRANAARALGVAEDATALDALASRVASDTDLRVRVSAVRALAQLKDARAADPLLKRGAALLAVYRAAKLAAPDSRPAEGIELLEIATSVGRLLQNTNDAHALEFLRQLREAEEFGAPEVEGAFAHVAPTLYMRERPFGALAGGASRAGLKSWQSYSALAQGLGELAAATSAAGGNSVVSLKADAQILLLTLLNDPATPALAVPDVMRALATYKPASLAETVRAKLTADDVIVRATAADILAELDPDPANANALASALPRALSEELNDAALSILSALAHQKTAPAILAVKSALEVPDYVVRRRAESLLKELGAVGAVGVQTVATRNKEADYLRALSRIGRSVRARVLTDKGEFTLELLPAEAPLNVDNFVELARRGYFNNVTFHRVVPNFVVQGGDPRGDGNGGPGYQIRCEINTVPFARGAVGMALSGKDTGGSQWFITHSPQPHLDGGYTVFGRVVSGMEVVDRIARRDRILGVTITEGKPTATGGAQRPAARSR